MDEKQIDGVNIDRGFPRKPLIAAILSICPGLGQHYSGYLVRGIVCYFSLIVVSWASAIAYMLVEENWISLLLLFVPFICFVLIGIDAVVCANRNSRSFQLKWYNRGWIYIAVFLALIVTVNPAMDRIIGKHVVRAYFETTNSMYPSIYENDLVVINKLRSPKSGDIVLLDFAEESGSVRLSQIVSKKVLRRIVAREGDTVEIRENQLLLNGKHLSDYILPEYKGTNQPGSPLQQDYGPTRVPYGHSYVMAQNTSHGMDSRVLGYIPDRNIEGVATKIFWSWNFDDSEIKWNRTAMKVR